MRVEFVQLGQDNARLSLRGSLKAIVATMVGSEGSWSATAEFKEDLLALEEGAERERELMTTLPTLVRCTRAAEGWLIMPSAFGGRREEICCPHLQGQRRHFAFACL